MRPLSETEIISKRPTSEGHLGVCNVLATNNIALAENCSLSLKQI